MPVTTRIPAKVVNLKSTALTDKEAADLAGHLLSNDAYDQLFESDVDIYKPDGSLLCKLRQNVLSEAECAAAFPIWKEAAAPTYNRGSAAGIFDSEDKWGSGYAGGIRPASATRARGVKADGTLSNTLVAPKVQSGIVGYFDRNARFPYCRMTSYNLEFPGRFVSVMPFIRKIDAQFQALVPDRYEAQRQIIAATHSDFFIHGTAFTTVTVNRNFQTAVHQDKGDLRAGFGVMSALRRGRFTGCYFVFPKYRVALDMRSGCILCADVHEWHGNTPFKGNAGMFDRVSLVFYYREKMMECGSAKYELARAKRRKTAAR